MVENQIVYSLNAKYNVIKIKKRLLVSIILNNSENNMILYSNFYINGFNKSARKININYFLYLNTAILLLI